VYYFMGMGFGSLPPADSLAGRTLEQLRRRSAERNAAVVGRINAAFPEIAIDYADEVLPLTPSGNATERHIVAAYVKKARAVAGGKKEKEEELWSRVTGRSAEKIASLLGDEVLLHGAVRSALIKSGGVGYVRPDSTTFPPIDDVIAMILDARAMPMATWLNGLSEGERDMATQLDCLRAKGVVALNIIPDRNWNIADPGDRELKVRNLHEAVRIAAGMEMPLNVGTELNAPGQPFIDDFDAEPTRPLWPHFIRGANIVVGQARLLRWADFSYCGSEAVAEFGSDIRGKNNFFMQVGTLPPPDRAVRARLIEIGADHAFAAIRDSVRARKWLVA